MPEYTTLPVVVSEDYTPGYATFGVLFGGAFVPLSAVKQGHVDALQAAVSEDDPHTVAQPAPEAQPQSDGDGANDPHTVAQPAPEAQPQSDGGGESNPPSE